ncbi:hypothetical protein BC940DRAFT_308532 [Gongronella butleri]|nr:hypothetical protein BC940DRAFT_308532 [Gongronella butleri]
MARRPRSTAELGRLAAVQIDENTPIRLFFRSADLVIKQARVYKMEHDYEQAYILYMKYTTLGLSEMPKHSQFKNPEYKKLRIQLRSNCMEALDALEIMKPDIDAKHDAYMAKLREDQQQQQSDIEARHAQQLRSMMLSSKDEKAKDDGTSSENKARDDDWSLQEALKGVAGVGHAQHAQETRHASPGATAHYPTSTFTNQSDGYTYQAQWPPASPAADHIAPYLPPRPPKPASPASPGAPALPPKIALPMPDEAPPALPAKIEIDIPAPAPDPALSSGVTTERGEPLRILTVPQCLQERFLAIARPNTNKNIETCGILAGTLKNNVLKVTTLVIPKQTGTSDMCTTENEEELFEYQDTHDLLTFGWIHTHPSQSCFLSSVDLHTHCSYQLMLPEAIAIVCAPKHDPNYGIFRLTDPPGLEVISNCRIQRAFHPHDDLPIYTDTHSHSHVRTKAYDLKVVDLR